jgi:hypothetical protein
VNECHPASNREQCGSNRPYGIHDNDRRSTTSLHKVAHASSYETLVICSFHRQCSHPSFMAALHALWPQVRSSVDLCVTWKEVTWKTPPGRRWFDYNCRESCLRGVFVAVALVLRASCRQCCAVDGAKVAMHRHCPHTGTVFLDVVNPDAEIGRLGAHIA